MLKLKDKLYKYVTLTQSLTDTHTQTTKQPDRQPTTKQTQTNVKKRKQIPAFKCPWCLSEFTTRFYANFRCILAEIMLSLLTGFSACVVVCGCRFHMSLFFFALFCTCIVCSGECASVCVCVRQFVC